jgi:hypothetical protein
MVKHSKTAAVEVLPPEDPNTADSEQSRLAANYAIQAHEMTKRGAQMFAVGALICGFIMTREKARLEHGQFEKWRKKYLKPIQTRTAQRYTKVAQRVAELQSSKCDTVTHLLESTNPSGVTEHQIQKIAPLILEITEGKTFTELGRELGIFKPRETKARKFARKHGPRTGDHQADAEHDAQIWADDVEKLLEPAGLYKDIITDKDLTRVAHALNGALAALGLIKIEPR